MCTPQGWPATLNPKTLSSVHSASGYEGASAHGPGGSAHTGLLPLEHKFTFCSTGKNPHSFLRLLNLLLGEQLLHKTQRETEVRTPKNIEKMRQEESEKRTDHILQTNYISPPLSLYFFSDWTVNLGNVGARPLLLYKEMVMACILLCQLARNKLHRLERHIAAVLRQKCVSTRKTIHLPKCY